MNDAYNDLKRLQDSYGASLDYYKSRIPELKIEIDEAYQESRNCYEAHDGAGARDWSDKAKQLRQEREDAFTERNRMIEELKAAREHFNDAKQEFNDAKAEFERDRDAFTQRLNHLREESQRKREERERQQAERDEQHRRREERKRSRDAQVPMCIDRAKSDLELKIQEWREDAARRDSTGRRAGRQFQEPNVRVINGYSRDHDVYTTDIIIFQPGLSEHLHIVFDEYGNEIFNEWQPNH